MELVNNIYSVLFGSYMFDVISTIDKNGYNCIKLQPRITERKCIFVGGSMSVSRTWYGCRFL